jgi:hypothetical protein
MRNVGAPPTAFSVLFCCFGAVGLLKVPHRGFAPVRNDISFIFPIYISYNSVALGYVAFAAQDFAGEASCHFSFFDYRHAIHQHVLHSFG